MSIVKKYLDTQDLDSINKCCEEIYERDYYTGDLNGKIAHNMYNEMEQFYDKKHFISIDEFCDELIVYVSEKFAKLISLSMLKCPYKFIRFIEPIDFDSSNNY